MAAIVEMRGLRKVYGRGTNSVVAINDLHLEVGHPGRVHGFLGPNGSGKTTTIRCLLGLIQPTAGDVTVFGSDSARNYHMVASRVGAIVENPKMFPNFSARQNLNLLARIDGVDRREVDRVLDIVGLRERAAGSFKSYSLGMKQRLAIAAALLKDPDLLILDEPANGLDPAGIAAMRQLISDIAAQEKAVLVSSHQLAEVEQVCDDVTIINHGHLVESGTLEHIRSFAGEDRVIATIAQRDQAIGVLGQAGVQTYALQDHSELLVGVAPQDSSRVTQLLADQGLYLSGLRTESATLEAAFLNLTAGGAPPPGEGTIGLNQPGMAPSPYAPAPGPPPGMPAGPPPAPTGPPSAAPPPPTTPPGPPPPAPPPPAAPPGPTAPPAGGEAR